MKQEEICDLSPKQWCYFMPNGDLLLTNPEDSFTLNRQEIRALVQFLVREEHKDDALEHVICPLCR